MAVHPSIRLLPDANPCQIDLPLDWYQVEFRPYAHEYLDLPDRAPETVLAWLDSYVRPAIRALGDDLLLVAHSYMGGEIVRLIERYGGTIGDSYELALLASRNPRKRLIVEAAVHFMAEAIAILAHDGQSVWITNPKAGCTLEMMAKEDAVVPLADRLLERFGDELAVVAYMNTSGRVKALAGRTGGAVCTSSNAHMVLRWVFDQGRRVLFVPDRNLGLNVAERLSVDPACVAQLPPAMGAHVEIDNPASLDHARLILWGAYCGVHTVFTPAHVEYWHGQGWSVLVHPECPREVVRLADDSGSTRFLWDTVMRARPGSRFAIGTEGHFVRTLRERAAGKGVGVVHLAATPGADARSAGCACAMMSRNDPPHLAGMLDLLRRGEAPDINRVLPGDLIDETTGRRDRLRASERTELARDARLALQRMIDITER